MEDMSTKELISYTHVKLLQMDLIYPSQEK